MYPSPNDWVSAQSGTRLTGGALCTALSRLKLIPELFLGNSYFTVDLQRLIYNRAFLFLKISTITLFTVSAIT